MDGTKRSPQGEAVGRDRRVNSRTTPGQGGIRSVPGQSIRGRQRGPSANTNALSFVYQSCSCCPKKQFILRESNKKLFTRTVFLSPKTLRLRAAAFRKSRISKKERKARKPGHPRPDTHTRVAKILVRTRNFRHSGAGLSE